MKKWIALLVLLVVLALGYVAAGPFLAIRDIRGAIDRQDTAAVARRVDFPAIRASLHAQVDDYIARRTGPGAQDSAMGAIATQIAGGVASGVVDLLATPAGLGLVLEGRGALNHLRASTGGDAYSPTPPDDLLERATYRYESPSRFTVTIPNRDGAPVVFVLTRQGLDWRVTDVRLPLVALDPTVGSRL